MPKSYTLFGSCTFSVSDNNTNIWQSLPIDWEYYSDYLLSVNTSDWSSAQTNSSYVFLNVSFMGYFNTISLLLMINGESVVSSRYSTTAFLPKSLSVAFNWKKVKKNSVHQIKTYCCDLNLEQERQRQSIWKLASNVKHCMHNKYEYCLMMLT